MGITQKAMRGLWLLGPARVEQIQKVHRKARGNAVGAVPRFRSRRTVGLLGYLAAERRPFAREHLAALLWPDVSLSRGRGNLRRELHNLAEILPNCWELDRQSAAFVPSADTTVDLYTLLGLEAEERWGEAAELLGGEFLEGLYLDANPEFENWLLGERERWRGRAEGILQHVIEGHWRRGRYTDALHHAQRLLQLAPWNEQTHANLMRLLAWTGQRGAALRQFETCQQTLWKELGVQPSGETIALCQQIQAGKLDLPLQLPAFLTDEKARREFERLPFVGREDELAQLDTFIETALAGRGRPIFITGGPGRGKTALLDAFAQRAMETHPTLLVASGKCNAYSGVGDPYLPYRDMMSMLTVDVEGRWDAGAITRDHARRLWATFSPIVQILLDHGSHLLDVLVSGEALLSRALAAGHDNTPLLPRLRDQIQRQEQSSQSMEQSHIFQQVFNVLCTISLEQPLLLILDDLQWADTASIGLLFHIGQRLADTHSRLLIACAYRPEEVTLGRADERHPLAKPLSEFKRNFGDVWVDLDPFDATKERRFIDALLDSERNRLGESFRAALYKRTEGHPLFTIELLRGMQERGDLLKDEEGNWIEGSTLDWEVFPARVEAVIEERIDRLDPGLQEILTIASVEGEVFTAQVVAELRKTPERSILRRLSQDLERRHRVVREQEEVETNQGRISRYRFGHILFQEYLYKRLSQGEKRMLHADVATALEALYAGQQDEMSVQLAKHFHWAEDYGKAFNYYSLAAERAARLYESREAITHYTRAIQLAEEAHPDAVSLVGLHRGRGLACEKVGEFEQARADYEMTLQIGRATGERLVEWRALIDLGKLWRSRDYNQARGYIEIALELARQTGDPVLLADNLNWMGNWYANDEQPLKAVEYHQKALVILKDFGDRQALATTLDLLGIANLLGSDLYTSLHYYDRAILLHRELDDQPRLVSSLIGRATTVSVLFNLESAPVIPSPDAALDFEEALQIAGEIDSVSDKAWVYWSLGQFHAVHGHFGSALKDIHNSLRIASDIGHGEYMVGARTTLGRLYVELFAAEKAQELLEEALILAGDLSSETWRHLVIGSLAGVHLILDDPKQAQSCLEQVILHEMDTGSKRYCWMRRAELALATDDPALALDITDRLIASAPGMSPGRIITYLWKLKAEALVAMDPTEKARLEASRYLILAAIENAEASGERFLLWRLRASLGQLYFLMGRHSEAENEFSKAREFIQQLADSVPDGELRDNFLQRAHERLRVSPYHVV
jgi:DNA-binding SARP family transcriptional activator